MRARFSTNSFTSIALPAMALAGITVVCSAWLGTSNPTIPALGYLLVVLVAAAYSTLWIAIVSSLVAVLLLNYFFLPPTGTFRIAQPDNWVALGVLLVVSLIASHLSASARSRTRDVTASRDELSRLFELSRDILRTTASDDAYVQLARAIARRFDLLYVAICLPGDPGWRLHEAGDAVTLPYEQLEAVLQAARSTWELDGDRVYSGRHSVHSSEGPPVELVPLRLAGRAVGLLAMAGRTIEPSVLDALTGVAAIAVERVHLLEEGKRAELARQSAELRSSVLASLAHDLRTPLTAIRVAASNLRAGWANDEAREAQSEIVLAEVGRLNRLFQNIFDMVRIEARAVTAEREWVTPGEIVEAALEQVRPVLAGRQVAATADEGCAVHVDPRLTSPALAHLVENAAQYSPPGSRISILARAAGDALELIVDDQGPGIPLADMPLLFERFSRGQTASGRPGGVGMGLAISRGLTAAQGGTVSAANRQEGGARFSIRLPAEVRPIALEDAEPITREDVRHQEPR